MKKNLAKRDPIKNYFPLPNEIYQLGLSSGAIAVYGYLLRIEDRTTYQCHPSYSTIGSAVGMSKNTVRKYVAELEERGLIRTEHTSIITQDGRNTGSKADHPHGKRRQAGGRCHQNRAGNPKHPLAGKHRPASVGTEKTFLFGMDLPKSAEARIPHQSPLRIRSPEGLAGLRWPAQHSVP